MKLKLLLPTLLFSISLVYSCKKNDEPVIENKQSYPNKYIANLMYGINQNSTSSAKISYTAIGLSSYNGQHSSMYYGYAEFFNENVGEVSFGNISIVPNPSFYGTNNYYFSKLNKADSTNQMQWGTTTTFGINGGGSYSAFNTRFYVPEVLFLNPQDSFYFNGEGLPNSPTLSKSKPNFTLNWNSDTRNDSVAIVFMYDGTWSHTIHSNLSSNSFATFTTCSDQGNYTLHASDLNSFPVGTIIDIYVGRGNNQEIISNGRTVYVTANTYAKQTFIIGN